MQNNIAEQENQNYMIDNIRFEIISNFDENGKEVQEIIKELIFQSSDLEKKLANK